MIKTIVLQNRLGTSEKKQMHTLVRELANDMKVTELQSRDVLRRLILHQTITDEPPANMANQIVATSIDGSATSVASAFTEGGAEGIKAAVHHRQDGLVSSATTAETDATQPSDDADSAYYEAKGEYNILS